MKKIFVDTVGFLALWDATDQWHATAESVYQRLLAERFTPITTSFVLLECGNAVAKYAFRREVLILRERFESAGTLIFPARVDWNSAWAAYLRGDAGNAGIVDHVSFVVMRRLRITQAFTHDRHFKAAGFEALF